MTTRNFNQPYNPTQMVDKQIGDVYPTVREVAQHLPYLVYLAQNLTELKPQDVELQTNNITKTIQWRYVTEDNSGVWEDLVPLSEITGREVEIQVINGAISWRYVGDTVWHPIVPLSDLKGDPGQSPEMQSAGNMLQWRLAGDATWKDLFDTSTLTQQVTQTAQALNQRMDSIQAAQQSSAIYADTLTALQAITGTFDGQGGYVANGAGQGMYRWTASSTSWVFLREDTTIQLGRQIKAPVTQVDPVADALRSGIFNALTTRVPTSTVASSFNYSSWTQAFDVGTDLTAGSVVSGIEASLQIVTGTTKVNVTVWRRAVSSTEQDRAGPGLAGDVQIATRDVPVSKLGLEVGLFSRVWIDLPVFVAETGYTYLFVVNGRNAANVDQPLGLGSYAATGLSQRRMGYYKSAPGAGFWSNLGAGSAIAFNLGTAQYVKSGDLLERTVELEEFQDAVIKALPEVDHSVSVVPVTNEFNLASGRYTWAICMVGGLDTANGVALDGVTLPIIVDPITTKVSATLYARPRGASWEAQPPGFTGDVLVGTVIKTVDELGLVPGAPMMQKIHFDLPRFSVAATDLYYLVIEATDVLGNRVLSAIAYQTVSGLAADQYRKFWRSGPTSAWSNAASSTTFRFSYDFTLSGFQLDQEKITDPVFVGDYIAEATSRWQGNSVLVEFEAIRSGQKVKRVESVEIAAVAGGTVIDELMTLRPAGGAAKTWSYLTDRTARSNLTNVVVKDAATNAVLVRDTDFWSIPDLGAFSLPGTSGTIRSVKTSYNWKARRYDLVVFSPLTGVVSVVAGTERDRDAGEFVPVAGSGQIPLFVVDVAARLILPVWDNTEFGKRQSEIEIRAEIDRNRKLMRTTLGKLRSGKPVKVIAYGDSNFAQMGGPYNLNAVRSAANTIYHDRTKDVGGLLQNVPYGSDVLAGIPTYDNGDGAGNVHTRFGPVWELIRTLEQAYGTTVAISNRSIPGTNTSNAMYHGLDTVRLNAAVADVVPGDIVIIGFGQNELGSNTTLANVTAICNAFKGAGASVIVSGCFRPNINDLHTQHTYANWRYTQRALKQAAYASGTAYVSTEVLYDDLFAGVMGLSLYDFCAATLDVHPGPREHKYIGARLASWID